MWQTHGHTTDEGVIFFFSPPPLNMSICFCKAATYFSRETTELLFFIFLLVSFVFVFGCQLFPSGVMFITMRIGACESDIAAAPSVSHYVSRHSFSHLPGRSAPPFVSVSFSNNNRRIKLSRNFRGMVPPAR